MGVLKRCAECGAEMCVQPSRKDRKKYCSRECMNRALRGRRRSPETEFKPGNRPQTWVPVGTESKMKGGYVKVKIAEPNVWRLRGHLVWEKHNGRPLPEGWIIRRLDGDPANDSPGNLVAMPRSKHVQKTLEDPEILRRWKEATSRAARRRWEIYRLAQQALEELRSHTNGETPALVSDRPEFEPDQVGCERCAMKDQCQQRLRDDPAAWVMCEIPDALDLAVVGRAGNLHEILLRPPAGAAGKPVRSQKG